MIFAYTPSVEAGSRPVSPSPACRTAVEFRNVSFRYAGAEDNALDAISFSIQKGQTVGIIGGTGAGKSTLVHLLSRFYDVTDGEILLNGVPLQDYPFAQLREIIGLVPQRAVLFRGTIRENMRWRKKDASDEEIWRALSIAQAGFVKDKPEGLDSLVMQEGKNFSGGQRQRLTIARALVGDLSLIHI